MNAIQPGSLRESPALVTAAALDQLLDSLKTLPGSDLDGFFGPSSITWHINRESAVFLGAGRAALLQLAHPWVSAALVHHSNLMHDAIGRFHSTFRVIYTMLFGTRQQATQAARSLYRRHTTVQGELPAAVGVYGSHEHYEANEVGALRWVFATLVESAILAHEFLFPALLPAQREDFYRESKRMAALCGIPSPALPETWDDLATYTAHMMRSPQLAVTPEARAMGQAVLSGVGTWVRAPRWYRALTASWLSPELRTGFDLSLTAQDHRSIHRAQIVLRRLYPQLPATLRFVGPFHEAQARLLGRQPGRLTLRSNRFWMGVPRLLYAQPETQ